LDTKKIHMKEQQEKYHMVNIATQNFEI
jgi:hypothetical protein